jgi:hypothetical protein
MIDFFCIKMEILNILIRSGRHKITSSKALLAMHISEAQAVYTLRGMET